MKQMQKLMIGVLFIIILMACSNVTPVPITVSTQAVEPSRTVTNPTPTITSVTSTPTFNSKSIVITPDDLFFISELKGLNTPDSEDFCEHLPVPQIVTDPDGLSLLSGRFVLCSWENWPWVINIAMDLDTGSLMSKDDERADIVMENVPGVMNLLML